MIFSRTDKFIAWGITVIYTLFSLFTFYYFLIQHVIYPNRLYLAYILFSDYWFIWASSLFVWFSLVMMLLKHKWTYDFFIVTFLLTILFSGGYLLFDKQLEERIFITVIELIISFIGMVYYSVRLKKYKIKNIESASS